MIASSKNLHFQLLNALFNLVTHVIKPKPIIMGTTFFTYARIKIQKIT